MTINESDVGNFSSVALLLLSHLLLLLMQRMTIIRNLRLFEENLVDILLDLKFDRVERSSMRVLVWCVVVTLPTIFYFLIFICYFNFYFIFYFIFILFSNSTFWRCGMSENSLVLGLMDEKFRPQGNCSGLDWWVVNLFHCFLSIRMRFKDKLAIPDAAVPSDFEMRFVELTIVVRVLDRRKILFKCSV